MNFYYLCATQSSNVGDLLINKMLIDELCKYGNVYIDCYNIPNTFKQYILENKRAIDIYEISGFSLKKGNIIKFYKFAKKTNIHIFTQSPGPLGKLSKSYSLYFKVISKILKLLKIRYYLIGNCCSKSIAAHEKISISNADNYLVRSDSSVQYLLKLGIKNVQYIPDLAFLYREKAQISDDKKTVTLSFREVNIDYFIFIKWLKQVLSILKNNGFHAELIYQVHKDKEFATKLKSDLCKECNITFVDEIIWFNKINYYSGKSIVISNRLHSLLLGALHNAIPLALCDRNMELAKITDVYNTSFKEISDDLLISTDSINKIEHILSSLTYYKEHLRKIVDYNSELCHEKIKQLYDDCTHSSNISI